MGRFLCGLRFFSSRLMGFNALSALILLWSAQGGAQGLRRGAEVPEVHGPVLKAIFALADNEHLVSSSWPSSVLYPPGVQRVIFSNSEGGLLHFDYIFEVEGVDSSAPKVRETFLNVSSPRGALGYSLIKRVFPQKGVTRAQENFYKSLEWAVDNSRPAILEVLSAPSGNNPLQARLILSRQIPRPEENLAFLAPRDHRMASILVENSGKEREFWPLVILNLPSFDGPKYLTYAPFLAPLSQSRMGGVKWINLSVLPQVLDAGNPLTYALEVRPRSVHIYPTGDVVFDRGGLELMASSAYIQSMLRWFDPLWSELFTSSPSVRIKPYEGSALTVAVPPLPAPVCVDVLAMAPEKSSE